MGQPVVVAAPDKFRGTASAPDIVAADNGTFTTVFFSETTLSGSLELYVLQQGEKAKLATPVVFI